MVKALVSALFKVVMKLVSLVLAPLDLAIKALIPDMADVFGKINAFFDLLGDYMSFGISYLGYTTETMSFVILLLTAIITIPLAVHLVKLALKWYRALMP